METLTAQQLYSRLTTGETNIVGRTGKIEFTLNDIPVLIKAKDSVGNLLQEWLKSWLVANDISHLENPNRQAFPDFYLDIDNRQRGLLEVKTFDLDRGPGFDIANFDTYGTSLLTHAYRLDSNYLIFAYRMDDEGVVNIESVWLKKIWEIAGASGTYPLKVQEKHGTIHNIRPVIWYSERAIYRPFGSKEEFLRALNNTRYQYAGTHAANSHWLRNVVNDYRRHTGIPLDVPNR